MDAEVEDELTKRVLLDPLGNSVLITVAFGGGAGVVIVQVAGLEHENKYSYKSQNFLNRYLARQKKKLPIVRDQNGSKVFGNVNAALVAWI